MLDASKRAIDLHAIGEKIEFSDARERTRGRRSDGIITLGPGRDGPSAHIHTQQVEGFEVLSGTMVVVAGGRSVTLRTGESSSWHTARPIRVGMATRPHLLSRNSGSSRRSTSSGCCRAWASGRWIVAETGRRSRSCPRRTSSFSCAESIAWPEYRSGCRTCSLAFLAV